MQGQGPWPGCRAIKLGLHWAQGGKQTVEESEALGTGDSSSPGGGSRASLRAFKRQTGQAESAGASGTFQVQHSLFQAAVFFVLSMVPIILLPLPTPPPHH